MTSDEAISIATMFGTSQGLTFDDHTIEAVFSPASSLKVLNPNDDSWKIYITYNPMKGIGHPDYYVIEVNCRTRKAALIPMA